MCFALFSIHVNRQAIAIGVLKKPVSFCHMGMPEVPVETEMMFMMAIEKPDSQVEWLPGRFPPQCP